MQQTLLYVQLRKSQILSISLNEVFINQLYNSKQYWGKVWRAIYPLKWKQRYTNSTSKEQ